MQYFYHDPKATLKCGNVLQKMKGRQLHTTYTSMSVYDQPPRSTQPGHPSMGIRSEYQPKGGDALRLMESKGRYGSRVGGR